MIEAKVITDSAHPNGRRLTTVELTAHRFILAEVNTHRVFSRNSASSRAIPTSKLIDRVRNDPALPIEYKANKAGMQAADYLDADSEATCRNIILALRDHAAKAVEALNGLNLHKQWANRYLEPFMWHTMIITSTEWDGFFSQRINQDAQPEISTAAAAIREAMELSDPVLLNYGDWHLPYILEEERYDNPLDVLVAVSAARCARVSYLNHDGVRSIDSDIDLYRKLTTAQPPHWSPLEHVATPFKKKLFRPWVKPLGNFKDFEQLRHLV